MIKVNTLLFVILTFMTGSVCHMVGIANGNTLHLFVIAVLFILNAGKCLQVFQMDKCLQGVMLFVIFMLIITFLLAKGDIVGTIGWITVPVICSLILALDNDSLKGVQKVLIAFFVVECLLSIYERKNGIAIFPFVEDDYYLSLAEQGQTWQFRSSSLLGNPLYNANFVSFVSCLLLCCDNLKVIYRYILALLGLFAILGFNARGATIMTSMLVLYKLYFILKGQKSKTNKYLFYILIVCTIYYGVNFVINTDWGGRLIQEELMDGSAQTRLSFGEYLNKISIISFPSWVSNVNKSENSYLFILISYGVFIGVSLIYFMLKLFFHYIRPYKNQVKILLLISAIGVGSMNNNLSGPGLFTWFFMYILAFRNELTLKKNR